MPQRWRIVLVLLIAVIAAVAMSALRPTARADSGIASLPNPYGPAESFGKLPPGRPWGSTSAIAIDSKGHVWVGERCGKNSCGDSPWDSILEFDPPASSSRASAADYSPFPTRSISIRAATSG